jgi:uncharacterized membrane protein (Fun14 family)
MDVQGNVKAALNTAVASRSRLQPEVGTDAGHVAQAAQQPGVLGSWMKKLGIDQMFERLGGSAGLIKLGMFAGTGFLLGYFFKKYTPYLIAALAGVVAGVLLGEYYGFLVVNWGELRALVTGEQLFTSQQFESTWSLLHNNMVVVAVVIVGFLVGHHCG